VGLFVIIVIAIRLYIRAGGIMVTLARSVVENRFDFPLLFWGFALLTVVYVISEKEGWLVRWFAVFVLWALLFSTALVVKFDYGYPIPGFWHIHHALAFVWVIVFPWIWKIWEREYPYNSWFRNAVRSLFKVVAVLDFICLAVIFVVLNWQRVVFWILVILAAAVSVFIVTQIFRWIAVYLREWEKRMDL
jgi:hypothetical protein